MASHFLCRILLSSFSFAVFIFYVFAPALQAQQSAEPLPQEAIALLPPGTIAPVKLSPRDIAAFSHTPDPELANWFNSWGESYAVGEKTPAWLTIELDDLLAKTPLQALDLLAIAHAFHFLSDDIATSALFYDAASIRVEKELAHLPPDKTGPILHAILYQLQDIKHVLWPLIEKKRQHVYALTMYRLYSSLVKYAPAAGDDSLLRPSQRQVVGAAEALYVLQRDSEAIALLEANPLEGNKGDHAAWSWSYALLLIRVGRQVEAAPYLEIVIKNHGEYAQQAQILLNQSQEGNPQTNSTATSSSPPLTSKPEATP